MINKQKMGLTGAKAGAINPEIRKTSGGQFGGGPQNYDGRANTNAGTPPPQDNYFEKPASLVVTDE